MSVWGRWSELAWAEHAYYVREYHLRGRALWEGAAPSKLPFLERIEVGRALDAGCGTGRDVIALAERGWSVIGLDLYARALSRARVAADRAGVAVTLIQGAATSIGREGALAGPFDLVLDVLGPASDLSPERRVIYGRGVRSALSPGGVFAVFTFEPHTALSAMFEGLELDRALAARMPASDAGRWWLARLPTR